MTTGSLCCFFLGTLGFGNPPSDPQLGLGTKTSRTISRGEIHSFQVRLARNQFARIEWMQREIDVSVSVRAPTGDPIAAFDSVPWGRESVFVIARAPGVHRIQVHAERDGPTSGSYEIAVSELRPVRSADRYRIRAQGAFVKGVKAMEANTAAAMIQGIAHFQEAASVWQRVGEKRCEAWACQRMGMLRSRAGQYEGAIVAFERAAKLWEQLGDELSKIATLDHLGPAYGMLGQKVAVLPPLTEVLELWQAQGDRRGAAGIIKDMGIASRDRGQYEKSLEYLGRAVSLYRALGDRKGESNVIEHTGKTYERAREHDKAYEQYRLWLSIVRSRGDKRGETAALGEIGRVLFSLNRHAEAVNYIQQAISLFRATGDRSSEARGFCELARAYCALGSFQESLAAAREAVSIAGSLRLTIDEPKLRAGFKSSLGLSYRQLVRTLVELHKRFPDQGWDGEAFRAADSSRALYLLDALARKKPGIQRDQLDENTLLLEYWLDKEQSFLWAVTATGIQLRYLPGRGEIEEQVRTVYAVLTARNNRIPGESAEQGRARIAGADQGFVEAAGQLSRCLLGPLASLLTNKRLLIVSDGVLQYLPFAVLPDPGRPDGKPLVFTHEIINLPSATFLGALQESQRKRSRGRRLLAVLADPVFNRDDPRIAGAGARAEPARLPKQLAQATRAAGMDVERDVPRLPFSRREMRLILEQVPRGEVLPLTGLQVRRDVLLDGRLNDYRIIHIATHGLLNDDPDLSGLILSLVDARGRPQDGVLRLKDLWSLRLPAELVVLSACQTALGRELEGGEGVLGLTAGFMHAGAARVLSTAWKIDDEATADLMPAFYRGLLGAKLLSAGAALRAAQLELAATERWQSPYYWGGFLLYGQWR